MSISLFSTSESLFLPCNRFISTIFLDSIRSVQSVRRVWLFATPWTSSLPGLPVHHQLSEFTQTHVHWVSDALQPSHPLLLPPSIIRVFSSESALLIRWPKCVNILYLFFSFWLTSLCVTGSASTSVHLTQMCFFYGWVIFHCIYVPQLLYLGHAILHEICLQWYWEQCGFSFEFMFIWRIIAL